MKFSDCARKVGVTYKTADKLPKHKTHGRNLLAYTKYQLYAKRHTCLQSQLGEKRRASYRSEALTDKRNRCVDVYLHTMSQSNPERLWQRDRGCSSSSRALCGAQNRPICVRNGYRKGNYDEMQRPARGRPG